MANPPATKQVYIIGRKPDVQKCVSYISGNIVELNNSIWTIFPNTTIGKGDILMENLKEDEMECDYSLDTASGKRNHPTSSGPSVNMKRLKSLGSSSGSNSPYSNSNADIGYESDSTETEEKEGVVDINAIVLEEEGHGISMKLASFIFQLFTWPAIIIIAISTDNFAVELYKDFIKELGVLASVKGDESSQLLVVGMTSEYSGEVNDQAVHLLHQHRDKLQYYDSYFCSCFHWCEINEVKNKLKSMLNTAEWLTCTRAIGRKAVNTLFRGERFLEMKKIENEMFSELLEKNLILSFKFQHKEYVCKPDDLMNEFMRTLSKMPDLRYSCKYFDIMTLIDTVSDRKLFVDAFKEVGLIHTEAAALEKTVHLMPMICKKNIPAFGQVEYSLNTNALRLSVELDIIPVFVMANIMRLLFEQGWNLKSAGPNACGAKESLYFVNHLRAGLLIQFGSSTQGSSNICICGFGNASHKESGFEKLRNDIEFELNKWKGVNATETSFISRYLKPEISKDCKDFLITNDDVWIELDLEKIDGLPDVNVVELLSPWFSSKVSKIETEMSKKMSDAFLADISGLFGYGYKLFFVSQSIPEARLSQIEMENTKSIQDTVFKMLLEWRKWKGLKANIAALRLAIKESDHVTVNLHDFDKMVQKHHGQM